MFEKAVVGQRVIANEKRVDCDISPKNVGARQGKERKSCTRSFIRSRIFSNPGGRAGF